MSEQLYKLNWQTHGFKAKDLPEDEWGKLTEEFMRLREQFVKFVNGPKGYDQLNKDWDNMYPDVEYVGIQNVDGYLYGSYLAWRINDAIRAKMLRSDFMKSDLLDPYVFMDGSAPDLGCRLKEHGDWTMDFTLMPV